MLTGIFHTLIGIRTKSLHIFLSTAYLVSLAVTVLIIYVMHPPISNAIQGAYFVAAFVTGIIFGGGSVVFADVTESLSCLLGGFCLSMWFLGLRQGGLIRSTIGKAIFIASFTLGSMALYFSRYTRVHALIASISFAGATTVILGVDCFSRAGLKEFWVYLWGIMAATDEFCATADWSVQISTTLYCRRTTMSRTQSLVGSESRLPLQFFCSYWE